MNPSGLTRSASQQSNNGRPSSATAVGNRFQSPGGNYQTGTPNSNAPLPSHPTSQQRYISYTSSSNLHNQQHIQQQQQQQQSQQQQFVTLDEFLSLKRQLERERGAREDAVSQLREQIYELKEARRRERLDAAYDGYSHNNNAGVNMSNGNSSGTIPVGSSGYHRNYYQQHMGGHSMDNSILGRLHRIEIYQSTHLQKQLEDLEERLRSRIDDRSKTSVESTRADLKKLAEQLDAVASTANALKHDVAGGRIPAMEQKIAEVSSQAQRNTSQIEVLQTHRIHDEEGKARMQQEIQALHDELRALDSAVDNRVEAANNRSRGVSSVDEAFVANEVDKRLGRAQDEQKSYVQERMALIESRLHDSNADTKDTLKTLASRVDNNEQRITVVEQRSAQTEGTLLAKSDEGLRALDEKLSGEIKNRSAEHQNILKDLKANMEAKFEDRINCVRDELDTDYSTQLGQLSDRIDDLAAQSHNTASQQNAIIRSLVENAENGKDASTRVLDSMEHFIRENMRINGGSSSSSNANNSDNTSSVYSSVLEKINSARQDEGGPVVGDALKILYQFERGQITNLTQLREDLADLRQHIGLVGLGGVGGGNTGGNNNNSGAMSPAGKQD